MTRHEKKKSQIVPKNYYRSLDGKFNGNFNARVIRKNEKTRRVVYWCGGQKLADDFDLFLEKYELIVNNEPLVPYAQKISNGEEVRPGNG